MPILGIPAAFPPSIRPYGRRGGIRAAFFGYGNRIARQGDPCRRSPDGRTKGRRTPSHEWRSIPVSRRPRAGRNRRTCLTSHPGRRARTCRLERGDPRRKRQRMNSESIMTHLPNGETVPVYDRMLGESALDARPEPGAVTTLVPGEQIAPARSLVQWGPILAGFFSATAIFLLLTALGIALGASVLEPRAGGVAIGPWPAVWAAITIIVAFLVGGWVASRSTLFGSRYSHLMDGFVV